MGEVENYFAEGGHDLSVIDSQIFLLANAYRGKIEGGGREGEIARQIISRACVDRDPRVAFLRNCLDEPENYAMGLRTDSEEGSYSYRLELAKRMKADVLELFQTRNALAFENGYPSYVDLVLAAEEIDKIKLFGLLNDFLDANLDQAKELILKYGLSFANWFSDLNKIGKMRYRLAPSELIERLLEPLGLGGILQNIKIIIRDRGFSGYAAELAPGFGQPIHSEALTPFISIITSWEHTWRSSSLIICRRCTGPSINYGAIGCTVISMPQEELSRLARNCELSGWKDGKHGRIANFYSQR